MKQFYKINPPRGQRYGESDVTFTDGELSGVKGKLMHYSSPSDLLPMISQGKAELLRSMERDLDFYIDETIIVDFEGKLSKEPHKIELFDVNLYDFHGSLEHFCLITTNSYGDLYDYFREELKFPRIKLMQ